MARRVIISEQQLKHLMEANLIMESIFEVNSLDEFKEELKNGVKKLLLMGIAVSSIMYMVNTFCNKNNVPVDVAKEVVSEVVNEVTPKTDNKNVDSVNDDTKVVGDWKLASDGVTATVYNAVPEQCNKDYENTASMFRLNLNNVLSHRIIAMERTFMQSLGLKFGDVVKIEGTGKYDGVWQVQDLMNKRFSGQKKIDILVPKTTKYGKWDDVKLYTLIDKSKTYKYKNDMAKPMPRKK